MSPAIYIYLHLSTEKTWVQNHHLQSISDLFILFLGGGGTQGHANASPKHFINLTKYKNN